MINTLDKLLSQRQFSQAVALGEQLVPKNLQNVHLWLSLSEAYRSLGQCDQAIRCSHHAFTLDPHLPFALAQYARCLLPTADYAAITALLEQGLRDSKFLQTAQHQWAIETLAASAVGIDNWDAAQQYYQVLPRLVPENPYYHYMLGVVYSVKGARTQAIAALQQAIALDPTLGVAYRALLDLDPALIDKAQSEAMCLAPALPVAQKIEFHYVRGLLLQKSSQYAESFDHFRQANTLKRSTFNYKVEDDLALFASLMQMSAVHVPAAPVHANSPGPKESASAKKSCIFIVGLPRSGSTLVENLLVNSEAVAAAGELRDFEVLLLQALGKQATQQLTPDDCKKLPLIDYARIGDQYRQRAGSRVTTDLHICDKNPFNFRFIGMILAALPEARIIHVCKQRMDALFGNYKHQFASVARYSYTLDELARYYDAYANLMRHWEEQFPGRILTLNYEDLLEDPVHISQQLYQYCGLSWQEDVLNTSTRVREIRTASANQVRQGLNTRAIGAWKPYSSFLQDLGARIE